jgi:hypothetical protein
MKRTSLILALVVCALACGTDILPKNEAISHEKNPAFSINFPTADWKLVNQQGTDSYVGYYENGKEKIQFDYGWYSGYADRDKATYYEEAKLKKCGCNATIFKQSMADGRTKLTALIYKPGMQNKTRLFVFDSEDDKKFIGIFKTHVFK